MPRNLNFLTPFGMAVLANVVLGTSTIAFKYGLEYIDPLVFAGLRYTLMGLIMLSFFVWNFSRIRDWNLIGKILLNTVFVGIFVVLWSIGLDKSSAIKAALLSLSMPIMMYLLSVFFLHESIIKRALVGCLIGLAGSVLIVGLPAVGEQVLEVGDVMLLVSYFFLALTVIHSKYLYKWLDPSEVITYRILISGLVITAFVFFQQGFGIFEGITTAGWLVFIYSATISGAFAVPLFYWALKNLKAEEVAPIFYLDPLTGAVGSALLLGDRLESAAVVGVGIVIVGLIISHPHHHHLLHSFHTHHNHWVGLKRWLYRVKKGKTGHI